jgi:alkylation response protein AidB-like acyl-CoA dehydrogenase
MDFTSSNEQTALADTLRRFLTNAYSADQRIKYAELPDGYSAACWRMLADLGLVALHLEEENGGLGGSMIDMMVALQALGPGLVLEPWLQTLTAARLIEKCASGAVKGEWLNKLASGQAIIGFAHGEREAWGNILHCSTTASPGPHEGFVLNGEKVLALTAGASHVLLTARISDSDESRKGLGLFLVPLDAKGLERRRYRLADGMVAEAIRLVDCPISAASLLNGTDAAGAVLEETIAQACIMLSSEAIGILDAMMAVTSEHLRTRKQFGVPLATFQAIQHRMADCCAELELARAVVIKAAILASDSNADRSARLMAAFGAKAICSTYGIRIAEECVQFHGAMGITEELWVGRAMKRLFVIAGMFGDARAQTAHCDLIRAMQCPAGDKT